MLGWLVFRCRTCLIHVFLWFVIGEDKAFRRVLLLLAALACTAPPAMGRAEHVICMHRLSCRASGTPLLRAGLDLPPRGGSVCSPFRVG